jgi:hypothetical protein
MNIKNFEYLSDQLKYTGFGEELSSQLKDAISKQEQEFKLSHHLQYGNDSVKTELSFSRSKQSDMYFFNSYQVSLNKKDGEMQQTFYINKGSNITLKEAYNLMEGRAVNKDLVNKEGQIYNTWLQLDFSQKAENGNLKMKQFHHNYGFELESSLRKFPIRELQKEEFSASLMESLKKGNLQSVSVEKDGAWQKMYVSVNPQFKTVNFYDTSQQKVEVKPIVAEKLVAKLGAEADELLPKQRNRKRQKMSI